MNTVDIYGLFLGPDNLPIMNVLLRGYPNNDHINFIELAWSQYQKARGDGKDYAGILLTCGGQLYVYSSGDFFHR